MAASPRVRRTLSAATDLAVWFLLALVVALLLWRAAKAKYNGTDDMLAFIMLFQSVASIAWIPWRLSMRVIDLASAHVERDELAVTPDGLRLAWRHQLVRPALILFSAPCLVLPITSLALGVNLRGGVEAWVAFIGFVGLVAAAHVGILAAVIDGGLASHAGGRGWWGVCLTGGVMIGLPALMVLLLLMKADRAFIHTGYVMAPLWAVYAFMRWRRFRDAWLHGQPSTAS